MMSKLHILAIVSLFSCVYSATIYSPWQCNVPANNSNCVIQAIAWFSQTSSIVVTGDNKTWVSNDSGQTYTQAPIRQVNFIVSYPENPSTLFLLPTTGMNITYTTNGGSSFQVTQAPVNRVQIAYMSPHPSQVGWILIIGCTTTTIQCTLYTTKNYGLSWTTSFKNDIATDSAGPAVQWGNSTAQPDLIFLMRRSYAFGYTTDYGSFTQLFGESWGFYQSNYYYWVLAADSNNQVSLQSSSYRVDPTHKNPGYYRLAKFPYGNEYQQEDYMFLDDSTRSEYVAIHTSNMNEWGDVYNSVFDGQFFEISLPSVYRYQSPYGLYYDFHRVRGLSGIYIANVVSNPGARVISRQTVITFNNGADWNLLQPPATNWYGDPWACGNFSTTCSLHLQGETGVELPGVQALRSHSNAIGIIVANGNVGAAATFVAENMGTFISRDGGLTWRQIYPGASLFDFGNHGGIMVLAPTDLTSNIYYTFNQGETQLVQAALTIPPMYFYGIATEPNGTGLNFLIQGFRDNANYMFTFSLADVKPPNCQDSDYEEFQPTNGVAGSAPCFLGQTLTYTRRKATSVCYNTMATSDTLINAAACACSWEDYECSPNYSPSGRNSSLGFSCTLNYEQVYPCLTGSDTYYEETGYQLIPDTGCTISTGLNLLGVQKPCPSGGDDKGKVAAAVVSTLLILGTLITLFALYFKNERFHNWVTSLFSRSGGEYTRITA